MGGKSGGGGNTGTTISQNILPEWLDSASQQAVQTAQGISQQPYTPYTGQVVAQPGSDTQQAYQEVRDMQGATDPAFAASNQVYGGLLGQAAPITGDQITGLTNQLYGNFAQGVAPAAGLLGNYAAAGPVTAQGVANNTAQLMNPYIGGVVAPTMQLAQQQLRQNMASNAASASQVGAFGGDRMGVQNAQLQAQEPILASQQIASLLGQGYNTALTAGTNIGTAAGQQGVSAAGSLASLLGQGYGNAASQAGGIANTNLQSGMTAASQLPALAGQQQGLNQTQASLLQSVGAAQQNQQQQELNAALGQFNQQQQYPIQSLDVLLSALGGVPYSSTSISNAQQQAGQKKSALAGAAGGAATGAAIGSVVPGWGTAIGAVAGGILGALG